MQAPAGSNKTLVCFVIRIMHRVIYPLIIQAMTVITAVCVTKSTTAHTQNMNCCSRMHEMDADDGDGVISYPY